MSIGDSTSPWRRSGSFAPCMLGEILPRAWLHGAVDKLQITPGPSTRALRRFGTVQHPLRNAFTANDTGREVMVGT